MNNKRLKRINRAFHDHFIAFNQTDYIDSTIGEMLYHFGEPVATGFNKLAFMQSGTLFYSSITFSNYMYLVYQVFFGPLSCSVPLDVMLSMFNIDGSRFAIHSKTAPVP